MARRYYMDQHVPWAITAGLRRRGVDVLRVQDDGHDRADNDVILDRAAALGRVVFTRDDDFLAEAHRRQLHAIPFPGVIYSHQDSASVRTCIADLEAVAIIYDPPDMANRVEYLPL